MLGVKLSAFPSYAFLKKDVHILKKYDSVEQISEVMVSGPRTSETLQVYDQRIAILHILTICNNLSSIYITVNMLFGKAITRVARESVVDKENI